jgi:hypothetical protein
MARYLSDFRSGDTVTLKIQYPVDMDITGYRFVFVMKMSFADEIPALQAETIAGSDPRDDATHGLCHLTIPHIVTATIDTGGYYYGLMRVIDYPDLPRDVRTLVPPPDGLADKVMVAPQIAQV